MTSPAAARLVALTGARCAGSRRRPGRSPRDDFFSFLFVWFWCFPGSRRPSVLFVARAQVVPGEPGTPTRTQTGLHFSWGEKILKTGTLCERGKEMCSARCSFMPEFPSVLSHVVSTKCQWWGKVSNDSVRLFSGFPQVSTEIEHFLKNKQTKNLFRSTPLCFKCSRWNGFEATSVILI